MRAGPLEMILDPLAEVMEADDGQATLAAVSIIRSAAQSWLWMGSVWGRGEVERQPKEIFKRRV